MARWAIKHKKKAKQEDVAEEKEIETSDDPARQAELDRRAQFGSQPDAIPLPQVEEGQTTPANFNLEPENG
jgi:hypothetical protein